MILYVCLIWSGWIYENVIITSNIMQFPFHGLLTSSRDILQFQAIIVSGQTAAQKWYQSLVLWWRWADFTRLSFPCSESDAQVWLEADGQKHMHARCYWDQLDRSLILTRFRSCICDYYTGFCADCIMMLQGCSNIKTVKMASSCWAVHEFVKWREMGLMTWVDSKVPVDVKAPIG